MQSYSDISASLEQHLDLAQPPLAVCLTDAKPVGVEEWSGQSPAGCLFWQEASKRVFATSANDHRFCSIGQYTHNLEMSPGSSTDLKNTLKVLADLTYVRDEDLAAIPVLAKKPKYVVYGPLSAVPVEPDVVLLFARADQTLILSEASQQVENGLPPAMGRPACAIIAQAKNTGRSALSLGCCGARAYLDVLSSDIAIYAIPAATLGAFADRITALSQSNWILTAFHKLRRKQIEAGGSPTIEDSLAALEAAG